MALQSEGLLAATWTTAGGFQDGHTSEALQKRKAVTGNVVGGCFSQPNVKLSFVPGFKVNRKEFGGENFQSRMIYSQKTKLKVFLEERWNHNKRCNKSFNNLFYFILFFMY